MKRLEIRHTLGSMDVLVGLARYQFVCRTFPDRNAKILDYGCGSGYGTRILKENFRDVVSFDQYPDGYRPDGLEVITDPASLRGKNFGIITCFEVIEHMDETSQNELMDELSSLLHPAGTLYISTVRKMDPPPTENRRKWHVRELSFEELLGFCQKRFRNVYTFGQIDQVISTFNRENCYHNLFVCTVRL